MYDGPHPELFQEILESIIKAQIPYNLESNLYYSYYVYVWASRDDNEMEA